MARAAGCHVTTGDARRLHYLDATFDAICTSPTYGNRMADHHNARDSSPRLTPTATPLAGRSPPATPAPSNGAQPTGSSTARSGPNAAACLSRTALPSSTSRTTSARARCNPSPTGTPSPCSNSASSAPRASTSPAPASATAPTATCASPTKACSASNCGNHNQGTDHDRHYSRPP